MDLKKVIIAVIVLLVIVVGAYFVLQASAPQVIKYDEHFNVSVPSNFKTDQVNGAVTAAYPENKSYVVTLAEDNTTAADMDNQFKIVQDAVNVLDMKDKFTDIKTYNVGKNKAYEYTTSDADAIKEAGVDAKKVRAIAFVVPNSNKVYDLYISTNDTSVDLNNADIGTIINSTSQA